ncbi:MAG TPA: DUF4224 domain-containing protein [Terriglobales bacterium]|nr:DUF4224 domain-containing protein [Terriglobales bacterium]HTT21700.1 DUF4224 domain-containing protein [Candidatus Sulfotelmatobacter sp.]
MASNRSASSIASARVIGSDTQLPSREGDVVSPQRHDAAASAGAPTLMFLSADELAFLTGRHRKTKQIQQLQVMGIPFYENASGHPIVARVVLAGDRSEPYQPRWIPAVAKLGRRE